MYAEKPRLIFKADVERRRYFRRFMWMLLALVTTIGAVITLEYLRGIPELDDASAFVFTALDVGQWVGLALGLLLLFHMLRHFIRWLTTRTESLRFFDRGFVWKQTKAQHKYGWMQLRSFRRGGRTLKLFGRPVLQTGAHTLTMRDGKVFKVRPRHGNLDRFAVAVAPYVAEATGTAMGRALRKDKSVRIHPQVVVKSNGVVIGKQRIPWSRLDVQMRNGKLALRRVDDQGKFKTVKTLDIRKIDNLDGFLDVADSTIRNHQPERFNIHTQEID